MPETGKRVSDKAATLWAYIQNWAARGISLLVFFVLARLLTPAEFGAFAVSMIFLTLGEIFVEQLFGHAIVQRETVDEAHRSSAFWATLGIGLGLAGISLVIAPSFAAVFDSPSVAPIIRALTPVLGFMALSAIPSALLRRELDYRALAKRTALSNLLSGAVAIAAALYGLGVWTFVIQQLVFQAVGTWVLWRGTAWRPQRRFEWRALKELFHYASRITLVKLLDLVETRVLEMIIARTLGIAALGNYALATRAQQSATQLLAAPLWESSIAIFARRQNDRAALGAALNDRALLASVLIMPVFLFSAATAESLVPAVFGRQWQAAVAPFQVLCLLGALRAIAFLLGAALQAIGEAGAALVLGIARTVFTLCALPFLLVFDVTGVACAVLLGQALAVPIVLRIVFVKLGLSSMSIFSGVLKPIIAAVFAAGFGWLLMGWMGDTVGPLVRAIICLAFTTLIFGVLLLAIMPSRLRLYAQALPHRIGAPVCALLDRVIRLKEGGQAVTCLALLRLGASRGRPQTPADDVILVFPDAYTIGGSLGDQALFGGLVRVLRDNGISHARVLSRPGVEVPMLEGIELQALPLWGNLSQAQHLGREMVNTRAVIFVGADVLDGFYSRFESLLRLGCAGIVARQGVPAILCSFSFNDKPDPATVAAFKRLPANVAMICRDAVSRSRLVSVVGERVRLMADLAYLLEPAKGGCLEQSVATWLAAGHRGSGPVIGWNLSPHSLKLLSEEQRSRAAEASAEVICRLVSERDASVVLIPHDFRPHASDPAMLSQIFAQIPAATKARVLLVSGPYTAAEVKQVCFHFDLVLTGRMHLMIAALGRDVPVVAVEYQGKFAGALAHFGLGQANLLEPAEVCSAPDLYRRVSSRLDDMALTRAQIMTRRPDVEALATRSMMECLRGAF